MKQGEARHLAPKEVHDVKNASATAPMKGLIFQVPEKGQPLVTPVRWGPCTTWWPWGVPHA
jgi:hypothetical protein